MHLWLAASPCRAHALHTFRHSDSLLPDDVTSPATGDTPVDKNRIEGATKQVKGSVKEAIGKLTGDKKTEAEGATEKAVGKAQRKVGEFADTVRDKTAWK